MYCPKINRHTKLQILLSVAIVFYLSSSRDSHVGTVDHRKSKDSKMRRYPVA
jgi:hypothetical protein